MRRLRLQCLVTGHGHLAPLRLGRLVAVADGGDEYDGVEEGAGEGPALLGEVLAPVPAADLHGVDDLLLKLLHLGLDQPRPVILLQHVQVQGQLPDPVPQQLPVLHHVPLNLYRIYVG